MLPKTILLVDDDFVLSRLVCEVIELFGYQVLLAHSGPDAEELALEGAGIDLLLTDIRLKKSFDGYELARRVRAILPDLPVLYISGHAQRTASEMGGVDAPILQKPVPLDELEQAISTALA